MVCTNSSSIFNTLVYGYKYPRHIDVVERDLRRMWDETIPDEPSIRHESQVSIYCNQRFLYSLLRSVTKAYLILRSTRCQVVAVCLISSKKVPRSCTPNHGDVKDGCLWCEIIYTIHQGAHPISIKIYKKTTLQVPIYDIEVSRIPCRFPVSSISRCQTMRSRK